MSAATVVEMGLTTKGELGLGCKEEGDCYYQAQPAAALPSGDPGASEELDQS